MAGRKILIADDSLTIQKVIRLALAGEGYDIQAVSDGTEALQQIAVFRPDVVLIDVLLPNQSAFEVKEAINQHEDLAHVRFVLMSSAYEKYDEDRATRLGFHGRLTKPFDPTSLRQVLAETLSHPDAKAPDLATDLPPPLPPPFKSGSEESTSSGTSTDLDIRNLTESTIRMSGLDDFEWNIHESGKKEPSLPPLPALSDLGDSNFDLDAPLADATRHESSAEHDLPEHLTEDYTQDFTVDITGSNFLPSPGAPHSDASQTSLEAQVDPSQLEAMVSRELHSTLEKMAQKLLPEIAEKIIKQEIHRLLKEMN